MCLTGDITGPMLAASAQYWPSSGMFTGLEQIVLVALYMYKLVHIYCGIDGLLQYLIVHTKYFGSFTLLPIRYYVLYSVIPNSLSFITYCSLILESY